MPISHTYRQRGLVYTLPAIILLGVFFIYPLIRVLLISCMDWKILGNSTWVGLRNYTVVLRDKEFWDSLWNTCIYTIIVTPMISIPALFFAVLLTKSSRRNSIFRVIIFIPCTISFVASSYIWVWIYNDTYGILNYLLKQMHIISQSYNWLGDPWSARFMISISIAWKTFGFSMLILISGLGSISPAILESAAIDGASKVKIFRSITLPLIRPTLMLSLVMSIAGSFKAFDQFMIMTGGGPMRTTQTIIMYINKLAFDYYEIGSGSAVSVLFLMILLFLSYQQLRLGRYDSE